MDEDLKSEKMNMVIATEIYSVLLNSLDAVAGRETLFLPNDRLNNAYVQYKNFFLGYKDLFSEKTVRYLNLPENLVEDHDGLLVWFDMEFQKHHGILSRMREELDAEEVILYKEIKFSPNITLISNGKDSAKFNGIKGIVFSLDGFMKGIHNHTEYLKAKEKEIGIFPIDKSITYYKHSNNISYQGSTTQTFSGNKKIILDSVFSTKTTKFIDIEFSLRNHNESGREIDIAVGKINKHIKEKLGVEKFIQVKAGTFFINPKHVQYTRVV